MPKEETDEYLEAVLDIAGAQGTAKTTDIAVRLSVAPASVTEMFRRLAKNGMLRYVPYRGVTLTERGFRAASRLKRKHRILEVFLDKILRLRREHIHEQACRMEHSLSKETETALCKLLKGPQKCPHGSTIPLCELDVKNCRECLAGDSTHTHEERKDEIISLTSLAPNQKGKIAFIRGGSGVVQRLSDLGLTPGTTVSLIRSAPLKGPIEIRVRGCNIIIGRGIAEKVFVHA